MIRVYNWLHKNWGQSRLFFLDLLEATRRGQTVESSPPPSAITLETAVSVDTIKHFHSAALHNHRTIEVFLPPAYASDTTQHYKVLYANDGQDMTALELKTSLEKLYADGKIENIIVVAIYATHERVKEYGVAGIPNSLGQGNKAKFYGQFLLGEVMPYIQRNYRVREGAANTAIMGASLAGLAAFDLTWQHPSLFGKVGVFSGSFWWRSDDSSVVAKQNSRIMHKVVRESNKPEGLKMWFQAGTEDEANDRDNNGVIDAIQDTTELMDELRHKGYRDGAEMVYREVVGGKHNQTTWAEVLPEFLGWAFPA